MKQKLFFFILSVNVCCSANAQWTPVNYTYTMQIHDIQFINEEVGFAAGYHQVYKTMDGGQNWTRIDSNTFVNGPVGVWFMNEYVGLIIGSDGGGNPQVSKTINGGNSWTTTTLPVSGMGFNDPNKIFFFDDNTGYIVCRSGHVYKTVDQGVNWFDKSLVATDDLGSVYFPTLNVGYISLSYSNSFLKTINGGNSWTLINTGQSVSIHDLYFTSADTGYFACSGSKILKTTDGGSSWSVFNFGTSDVFYTIEFTSKNVGYAAGSSGSIATTIDGGNTWIPNSSGVSQLLYCMDFPSQEVGYIGILDFPSKILKTTNGGGIISVEEISEEPFFKIYPNPVSDVLAIASGVSLSGSIYFIKDQLGRTVLSGTLTEGSAEIDVSRLVAGVYILQVDNRTWQSFKVIKD